MAPSTTIGTHRRYRLRPTAFAPRIARRFVYELGDDAGLPDDVVDDAAFVVGEFVVESIRQTHGELEVTVDVADSHITVRVRDGRTGIHRPGDVVREAPARSSATVRRLATSWGCCRQPSGWEVWAVLHNDASADASVEHARHLDRTQAG
ncbi:hypothetical protein [Mycolicibacterium sp. 050158]|uniref:ATP-binding protein n=1 Tax=Mycolicibacterium sp. 050158 TaxID=3090602 RepID=UPI00299D8F30|nr:hypothetical protein [Mycolicibacterium sp. 050158]MDX1890786.1 hypothetical protein [Mycolicibacterium sp. 050158]